MSSGSFSPERRMAHGGRDGSRVPAVDRLDDVARAHAALLGRRAGAGGDHDQEREAPGQQQSDVGLRVLHRLLELAELVRLEVGAVAVERVGHSQARARHRTVEVDRLDVGLQHQPHDLVEDRELGVRRIAQHAAEQGPHGDVADQAGGDEGDQQADASAH
jgi:nucleoside-diphosphate-sugar epimerase